MNLGSSVADLRSDLYFRNVCIHQYIRSGLVIYSNDRYVKEVNNFWKSIFHEILPSHVYITADVSILSLSVVVLFSLKSFDVYTGATVTVVVKHE